MLDPDPLKESQRCCPTFYRSVLKVAAIYNLLWGLAVIVFPGFAFELAGIEPPRYPQIWQCVGMIVGVYGIGYWIAAADPYRHWPIVLVGLLGKIFGPLGFLIAAGQGDLPWLWGVTIIFNDLIWWVPFTAILYNCAKFQSDSSIGNPHELADATIIFSSQNGQTLAEQSAERPLMIVFLRHFGCTFCREALSDLSRERAQIEQLGFNIALVHMSQPQEAEVMMQRYGLDGIASFSDGNCEIYRSFGLQRGTVKQLFGLAVVRRGIAATFRGHIFGTLAGDGFRMPGLFFLYRGEICGSYRHRTAADRPAYAKLAQDCKNTIEAQFAAG